MDKVFDSDSGNAMVKFAQGITRKHLKELVEGSITDQMFSRQKAEVVSLFIGTMQLYSLTIANRMETVKKTPSGPVINAHMLMKQIADSLNKFVNDDAKMRAALNNTQKQFRGE